MLKRICGILAAAAGLFLVIAAAVELAFAIPANFTTNYDGLDLLVDLAERYRLRDYIVTILFGMVLCLSALPLLLSPRKRRVAVATSASVAESASLPEEGNHVLPAGGEPALAPRTETVSRILRTRLMGATFRNPDGVSRSALLADMAAGDILLCRAAEGAGSDEIIGVYNLRGDRLGHLDTGFIRDLRARYPGFRIGITVERVLGGSQPYSCLLRVAVYG